MRKKITGDFRIEKQKMQENQLEFLREKQIRKEEELCWSNRYWEKLQARIEYFRFAGIYFKPFFFKILTNPYPEFLSSFLERERTPVFFEDSIIYAPEIDSFSKARHIYVLSNWGRMNLN